MKSGAFDRLLTATYRCPGNPEAWTDLCRMIGTAFGAPHVHIVLFGRDGRVQAQAADDPAAGNEYTLEYARRDLAAPKVMASAPGQVLWSHALLSREELARCPVQNELLPRVGVGSRTWIHSPFDDGQVFSTGILHGRTGEGLDARAAQRLTQLHAHLSQAMHLHLTLETARAEQRSLEAGLDAVGGGVLLLGRGGDVLFANQSARRLFDQGRLGAPDSSDDAAIRRVVGAALGWNGPARAGEAVLRDMRLRASPVVDDCPGLVEGAAVVVYVQNTAPKAIDPARLLVLGLTPAEAALAAAIGDGETVDAYAARTGRATGTIRAQLRAIFGKTDTHRQSELALLVTRVAGAG
jgi:DNA-binding CsgD family transcriptional regulator